MRADAGDGGEPSPSLRYHSGQGRWVIAATVLGSGMAAIDATVIGIALPTIGRDFHASLGTLQWVVTGYTLTLASLLLVGGSLGDRFGRRRVFMIGVAWFAAGLGGLRAVHGLDRAHRVANPPGRRRGPADARESGHPGGVVRPATTGARPSGPGPDLGGVATAAGPLLGGYLITAASWRWIFLINVPIGVAGPAGLGPARARVPRPLGRRPDRRERGGRWPPWRWPAWPTPSSRDRPGGGRPPGVLAALAVGVRRRPVVWWSKPGRRRRCCPSDSSPTVSSP